MSNYWTRTDDIKKRLGGQNPKCPKCGEEMFPVDDHGRFKCPNGDDPDSLVDKNMLRLKKKLRRKLHEKKKKPAKG